MPLKIRRAAIAHLPIRPRRGSDIPGAGVLGSTGSKSVSMGARGMNSAARTGNPTIAPSIMRYTQNSIKSTFSNGEKVSNLALGLKNGSINPNSVNPIRLVEKNGKFIFTGQS